MTAAQAIIQKYVQENSASKTISDIQVGGSAKASAKKGSKKTLTSGLYRNVKDIDMGSKLRNESHVVQSIYESVNNGQDKSKPRPFLVGKAGAGFHGTCTKVFQNLIFMDESGFIRDICKI